MTPWRLGSNDQRSIISFSAMFRYEKDAKKVPKPGVWGAAKTPAKAPAKAPAKKPAKK